MKDPLARSLSAITAQLRQQALRGRPSGTLNEYPDSATGCLLNPHPNLTAGSGEISDPRELQVQRSPFSGRINTPPKLRGIHAGRDLSKEDLADCRASAVAGKDTLSVVERHDAAISVELNGAE